MKANEFVKKYGWEESQYISSLIMETGENIYGVEREDLHRLVNAYELVESYGGLASARKEAHKDCFEFNRPLLAACYLVASVDA